MKPEDVEPVVAGIRELLLRADTAEVKVRRGMIRRENWRTGLVQHDPSGGVTATVLINGGAVDTQGEPIL